ncbi:MAG: hypothetical protein HXX09_16805 [Bacteroidetes bacterium]|nr:hypothetical protein [Bacteroidota bacterium]
MKFTISVEKNKTEPKYFKDENILLKIVPFKSELKGLKLCLENANGRKCIKEIFDTTNHNIKNIDITPFGYVWFEYLSTDKEYIIELVID